MLLYINSLEDIPGFLEGHIWPPRAAILNSCGYHFSLDDLKKPWGAFRMVVHGLPKDKLVAMKVCGT